MTILIVMQILSFSKENLDFWWFLVTLTLFAKYIIVIAKDIKAILKLSKIKDCFATEFLLREIEGFMIYLEKVDFTYFRE